MKSHRSTIVGFAILVVLMTAGAAQSLTGSNTVYSDDIVDNNVRTADLGTNSVTRVKIADNAIAGPEVVNNSITGGDVTDNSLKGADIDESTLTLPPGGGTSLIAGFDPPDETFSTIEPGSPSTEVFASLPFTVESAGFVTLLNAVKWDFDSGTCNGNSGEPWVTQQIDGPGETIGLGELGDRDSTKWLEPGDYALQYTFRASGCDGTIVQGSLTLSDMHARIYANE